MTQTSLTPEEAARQACSEVGLDSGGILPVRNHATSVFLLPGADVIVRVSRADQQYQIARAITLTRWLSEHELPVTEPLDVVQPVCVSAYVVSFWQHYPQPDGPLPEAGHLGQLLRRLHDLPPPPVDLPGYRPHASLRATVRASTALSADDAAWLLGRSDELLKAYDHLDFPLGEGLLHGDAYPGNTLWDGAEVRLGDWDEAAFGPREIDLANTFQGTRFGRTPAQLRAFSDAYGYDLAQWPGLAVLTGLRDLHTLGSFIRRADHRDAEAASQLSFRLAMLQSDDDGASWIPR